MSLPFESGPGGPKLGVESEDISFPELLCGNLERSLDDDCVDDGDGDGDDDDNNGPGFRRADGCAVDVPVAVPVADSPFVRPAADGGIGGRKLANA